MDSIMIPKRFCFIFLAIPGILSMSIEPFGMVKKPKPPCAPMEACGLFLGRVLPLQCSCPGAQQCSGENRLVDNKNMKPYVLCEEPTVLPVCELGQRALELIGYRHKFFCSCPNDLELVSQSWDATTDTTIYYCSQLRNCTEMGEVCARKVKVFMQKELTNFRSMCTCPTNQRCKNEAKFTNRTIEIIEWSCE